MAPLGGFGGMEAALLAFDGTQERSPVRTIVGIELPDFVFSLYILSIKYY
jgi:hypothetical protein